MHTSIHHLPSIYRSGKEPQKKMRCVSLMLIAHLLALLCPLLCVGYLFAADPDVVIYRDLPAVNATGSSRDHCILEYVCDNGNALCAQGHEVVLESECDPTGSWTAFLLLKWVYILTWLTRLPLLFSNARLFCAGKKVLLPDTLGGACTLVWGLTSVAILVISAEAYAGRNDYGTYFPTGFPQLLWYVMFVDYVIMLLPSYCDFASSVVTTPEITWDGVCLTSSEGASAVSLVLSAIEIEKNRRGSEELPQDTLHTAFHTATTAEMSRIVNHFCKRRPLIAETPKGLLIIVASRVLIDRNDLLVDMDIPASLKYRLLKACNDDALSTHVLQTIPIAELCAAINDVERNPDEALDYVATFGYVEKLIPVCKAVPSWRYMLPFVGSVHTPTCALLARGYKGALPKKRLYIAAAVMWVCVYLAGLSFSIYVCATLAMEEDTDGSMTLLLVLLVPVGLLLLYDVVPPPLRHALCTQRRCAASNSPSVEMREWRPDFSLLSQNDEMPLSADTSDLRSITQLEDVGVEGEGNV